MNKQAPIRQRNPLHAQRLSAEDTIKVLDLLKGSTSVELKLTIPDREQGAVIKRLGFDPVEGQPQQTYFFDTPDLALNKAGLIVRARRLPGGKGDTAVKLRPIDPAMVDRDHLRDPEFKIEVDAMPGGFVCSASAKGRCSAQEVLNVSDGTIPLKSLFSRSQRQFYAAHAPAGLGMKDLVALGPTFALKSKHYPKGFDRRITIELWLYPDGSQLLEISTKGSPEEAFQLAAQFRGFLASSGIDIGEQTGTKTNSALKFFSKQIAA